MKRIRNQKYELEDYILLNTPKSLRIGGFLYIITVPLGLSLIFTPTIELSNSFNFSKNIAFYPFIIIILLQILAYLYCYKNRLKYNIAHQVFELYSFLFNLKMNSINIIENIKFINEETYLQEYNAKFKEIQSSVLKFIYLTIVMKFGIIMYSFINMIEGSYNKTYVKLFFDIINYNRLLTVGIIILIAIFIGYFGYILKQKLKIVYGITEIFIGISITVYSLTSKITQDIDNQNILTILILVILFLSSIRLIISGIENSYKGLNESNESNWKKDYYK